MNWSCTFKATNYSWTYTIHVCRACVPLSPIIVSYLLYKYYIDKIKNECSHHDDDGHLAFGIGAVVLV